jgi:phosphate acyltransferase
VKIGVDIMGGDFAPDAIVRGAIAAQELIGNEATIVLVGDKDKALEILNQHSTNPNLYSSSFILPK